MSEPKSPPTPEQLEALKAKLIADPNTAEIAKTVGMPYDEYIATVLKYLANPSLEPQVYMAEDEDMIAAGFTPPDMDKIAAFIQDYADADEVSMSGKSKFADPNSQRERVSGKIPVAPAPEAKPDEVRKDLKEDLERARTSGKYKKF